MTDSTDHHTQIKSSESTLSLFLMVIPIKQTYWIEVQVLETGMEDDVTSKSTEDSQQMKDQEEDAE